MGDGVVGAHVDGLLLETEGTGEPVDGGDSIAVAEGWNDGFGLVVHGDNLAPLKAGGLGKNGRCGDYLSSRGPRPLPSPPLPSKGYFMDKLF